MANAELSTPQEGIPLSQQTDGYKTSYNPFTVQGRRNIISRELSRSYALPHEVHAEPEDVETVREALRHGTPVIEPYTHPDMRSPIDLVKATIMLGDQFDDADYVGPLAWHQQGHPHLRVLSFMTDIPLVPIVTRNTTERGKDVEIFSLKKKVQRKGQKILRKDVPEPGKIGPRHGFSEYVQQGAKTLEQGGIVFIAPQAGRNSELGAPLGAVEMFIDRVQNLHKKNPSEFEDIPENTIIWPVGVAPKNIEQFGDDTAGINRGLIAEIRFGTPRTLKEYQSEVATRRINEGRKVRIDDIIFEEFRDLVPSAYINDK